jgi:hypothetical protein
MSRDNRFVFDNLTIFFGIFFAYLAGGLLPKPDRHYPIGIKVLMLQSEFKLQISNLLFIN